MDLEKLRIFYHVIKAGSLLKASHVLDKNSSTISKHLSDLEEDLNKKLYIRKHHRLELTEDGRELFSVAQKTIPVLEEAEYYFKKEKHNSFGLTIVTTTGVIGIWLIRKIKVFLELYPNVRIKIITTNEDVDFRTSKADIGILPKQHDLSQVTHRKVHTVHSKLFASRGYLEKCGTPKTLEDLKNHKLIGFYSDFQGNIGNVDWHLTKNMNSHLQESWLTVNSAFFQFEAACQDLGIMTVAKEFEYLKGSNLINILPHEEVDFDVYAVVRSEQIMTDMIRNFIEVLTKN